MRDYGTALANSHAEVMRAEWRADNEVTLYGVTLSHTNDTLMANASETAPVAHLLNIAAFGEDYLRELEDVAQFWNDDEDIDPFEHPGFDDAIFDCIAEWSNARLNGFDIVENADGSAHATIATPNRVTDTELVTTRHADGTTSTTRQTASDARNVIEKGHATLASKIEKGEIENFVEEID